MQVLSRPIRVHTPFSLKATALSHGWHECAPMNWSEGGRCFEVIERHDDGAMRVSVTQGARRRGITTLEVTVEGRAIDDDVVERVCGRLHVVLGLDQDIGRFYALCRDHPTLHVLEKIGAGRGIRSYGMTENIIKALCATNVTWTQAVKMINRMAQLGPPLRHFVHLNAWPTPREILRAGERYLTEVCRVGYRAESILAFCEDVCKGRFDPDRLDELAKDPAVESDEILALLRSIRGIGPSSAHYLLSFLGRHDRLSIDSATVAHVARTHTRGRKPTHRKIERIYDRYGPWKNRVWWFEHWLQWDTARGLLREAGLDGAAVAGSN